MHIGKLAPYSSALEQINDVKLKQGLMFTPGGSEILKCYHKCLSWKPQWKAPEGEWPRAEALPRMIRDKTVWKRVTHSPV